MHHVAVLSCMNTFLAVLRRVSTAYSRVLSGLLVASVAILIFPVSLQIFSRYTSLIPSYIWTEERSEEHTSELQSQ